ncbi:MAG: CHAD domain-containing protein [bacterium]|nr:CHAD domain-containing protein [bacterium]
MAIGGTTYDIESAAAERDTLHALQERFCVRQEAGPTRVVTYHDTFDWRLHVDGGTLCSTPVRGATLVTWSSYDGEIRHRLRIGELGVFAWDFPAGPFREALARLIEMRRLLPIVEIGKSGWMLRILDGEEKTVARVVCERDTAARPEESAPPSPLPATLRILPVRGYDKAHRRLTRFLESELGLAPCERDELTVALAAIGRTPGSYSSKLRLSLDPALRADEATMAICRALLETMLSNEDGTRRDLDSEFLHDFRVAGRRTRSALSQIKHVFPPDVVKSFRREFAWLGDVTGPTRDLDVYLLKMDDYKAALPDEVQQDLAPLEEFLHAHQRLEQRRVVEALDSDRYRELIRSWRSFLDRAVPAPEAPANAGRPVRELAAERIWRAWRRILKKGRAAVEEAPAEALHALRIDCKKLRYLLEFFRSLFDTAEVGQLIKALKQVQDNLGDFNDLEIQQRTLKQYAHRMHEEGLAPLDTLMAMGRLVAGLESRQDEERRRFSECFIRFSQKDNRTSFRRLFASPRCNLQPIGFQI